MFKINCDSIYKIGSSHIVCQDYCLTGNILGAFNSYIIVCDGCSSSKEVDVGSRILAHCAKKALTDLSINQIQKDSIYEIGEIIQALVKIYSKEARDLLGLNETSLDSTLLLAFTINEKVYVFIYGDGNLYIKNHDVLTYYNFNYSSGAPYYLNYDSYNNKRNENYMKEFKDSSYFIKRYYSNNGYLTENEYKMSFNHRFYLELNAKDIEYLVLSSDGTNSFVNNKNGFIIENWKEFLNFKNSNGEFIQRRVNRILKDAKQQDINHYDDLGVAGLHFQEIT